MRFLICLNKPANPYTSALTEETMLTLSEQYDVVVNECMETDIQEEENTYWSHVAITDAGLAQKIRTMLEWHGIRYKDLEPSSYSWQSGKIGLEVFRDAKTIASILQKPNAEIIFYDGPRGHPH